MLKQRNPDDVMVMVVAVMQVVVRDLPQGIKTSCFVHSISNQKLIGWLVLVLLWLSKYDINTTIMITTAVTTTATSGIPVIFYWPSLVASQVLFFGLPILLSVKEVKGVKYGNRHRNGSIRDIRYSPPSKQLQRSQTNNSQN